MARAPSKIMTIAEKKEAKKGLEAALKTVNAGAKAVDAEVAAATKALAAAKKEADKAIAAAQKVLDAAKKKQDKAVAAAEKGRTKLTGQLATLEATPAEPAKRGPKPKNAD